MVFKGHTPNVREMGNGTKTEIRGELGAPAGSGEFLLERQEPRGEGVGLGCLWVGHRAEELVDMIDPVLVERMGREEPLKLPPACSPLLCSHLFEEIVNRTWIVHR